MKKPVRLNILDRAIGAFAPQRAYERAKARNRLAAMTEARNIYEAAQVSRRTQGWRRSSADANAALSPFARALRDIARDMVRNNPHATKAKMVWTNNVVGSGIEWKLSGGRNDAHLQRARELVRRHFLSTAIDADGRLNIYGLQGLAMDTLTESGTVLIRKRIRRLEDGYPLPFQIQIMEPDFIDTLVDGPLPNGNTAVQGVEFDLLGNPVAYYLFDIHPGSKMGTAVLATRGKRVSSDFVKAVYRVDRPGQIHGATWFAPAIVRMQDFADYTDAQLIRQKIAACFAAFVTTDNDFEAQLDEQGEAQVSETGAPLEHFEPGIIERLKYGEDVKFASPPATSDFGPYTKVTLREISAGLGIPYEALTGDLEGVNYSSGRLGWLEFQRAVTRWQWQMFIPGFCGVVEAWTNEALVLLGVVRPGEAPFGWEWTPPRREMIDPKVEIATAKDMVRNGFSSRSEETRAFGRDPEKVEAELAEENARADKAGLKFDSDGRGPAQGPAAAQPQAAEAEE